MYRRQLNDALAVYTSAASLSRDQREIEHIALYEKGMYHHLSLPCFCMFEYIIYCGGTSEQGTRDLLIKDTLSPISGVVFIIFESPLSEIPLICMYIFYEATSLYLICRMDTFLTVELCRISTLLY